MRHFRFRGNPTALVWLQTVTYLGVVAGAVQNRRGLCLDHTTILEPGSGGQVQADWHTPECRQELFQSRRFTHDDLSGGWWNTFNEVVSRIAVLIRRMETCQVWGRLDQVILHLPPDKREEPLMFREPVVLTAETVNVQGRYRFSPARIIRSSR